MIDSTDFVRHEENPADYIDWEKRYPKEIVDWAWSVLREVMKGECFVDNTRFAEDTDVPAMKQYLRQLNDGCCGYYDEVIKGPDGKTYIIGCNYGH